MAVDYESLYNDLLSKIEASGINISSLSKGDESISYRSADDIIKLAEFLNGKTGEATAAIRTIAKNSRETI